MRLKVRAALLMAVVISIAGCCDNERIPAKIEALYSQEARERNQAALDLAQCGASAAKAVPRLAQLLYDSNVGVQSSAAYALNQIDTKEARAVMEAVQRARRKPK